jgi:poly(3-hydroxybutyrate) depolymerase
MPDGTQSTGWNDGEELSNVCAWNAPLCQDDPNETQFFADIVAHLKTQGWALDSSAGSRERVYFFGNSNGAGASQRAASNSGTALPIAGIVAQVTPLLGFPAESGPGPMDYNRPHAGSAKVAQLNIMGDSDPLIPYDGGPRFGSDTFFLANVPDSNRTWAEHNGCSSSGSDPTPTRVTATIPAGDPTVAERYALTGCPSSYPVEYYKVKGGDHGSASELPIGQSTFLFAAKFFKAVESTHRGFQAGGAPEAWSWTVPEAPADAAVYVPSAPGGGGRSWRRPSSQRPSRVGGGERGGLWRRLQRRRLLQRARHRSRAVAQPQHQRRVLLRVRPGTRGGPVRDRCAGQRGQRRGRDFASGAARARPAAGRGGP